MAPVCGHDWNLFSFEKEARDFTLEAGCGKLAVSVLPHYYYPRPDDSQRSTLPGGAVAALLDSAGEVVCAGALVSERHVLTSLACARTLQGEANGTVGAGAEEEAGEEATRVVRIGNGTYGVAGYLLDPRARRELLALVVLDRPAPVAPLRMDDGGHVGSRQGSMDCNTLQLDLLSPPTPKP